MLDARRQNLQHAAGAGADVEEIARIGGGDDLDQGRLDLALIDVERADAMPLVGIFAEIGAREIGALPLDRAEPLQIEGDRRVGIVAGGDQLAGKRACRARLAETIEHPAALAEAVEEAGFAQQFQMARNPGLALPEDLRQLADSELAARAQDDEPKPGRLGNCAQCSQQVLHQSMLFLVARRNIYRYLYMCKRIIQFEASVSP